ncbi:MAG: NnrS family protein [Aestuariibacter sp.]
MQQLNLNKATEPTIASLPLPLFRLAFRPFFLLAAIFALVSVWFWVLPITGVANVRVYGGNYWWHIHEMMFGFGLAVVAGFLLTAVQTWTGIPGLKGLKLAGLAGLWLLARGMMILQPQLGVWPIIVVDMLFVPCVMIALITPIVRVAQWRNLIFAPILVGFMALNGLFHWMALNSDYSLMAQTATTTVLLMAIVITVIGGRVIPMFTANGTQTPKVAPLPWLEKLTLLSTTVVALLSLFYRPDEALLSIALVFSGVCHLWRILRWRIWVTYRVPMVWSLHLSYLSLALGLVLSGLAGFFTVFSFSQALHLVTIGAMAGMILAMMTRVSLGHTGRTIISSKRTTAAFVALFLAALIRVLGPEVISDYSWVLLLSGFSWSIAFALFLWRYIPILCCARVDGGAG